jgi:hypothetical protein
MTWEFFTIFGCSLPTGWDPSRGIMIVTRRSVGVSPKLSESHFWRTANLNLGGLGFYIAERISVLRLRTPLKMSYEAAKKRCAVHEDRRAATGEMRGDTVQLVR